MPQALPRFSFLPPLLYFLGLFIRLNPRFLSFTEADEFLEANKDKDARVVYHWGEYEDYDWEAHLASFAPRAPSHPCQKERWACYMHRKGLIRKVVLSDVDKTG